MTCWFKAHLTAKRWSWDLNPGCFASWVFPTHTAAASECVVHSSRTELRRAVGREQPRSHRNVVLERSWPKVMAWVDGAPRSTMPSCELTWLQAKPLGLDGLESSPGCRHGVWGDGVVSSSCDEAVGGELGPGRLRTDEEGRGARPCGGLSVSADEFAGRGRLPGSRFSKNC